MILACFPKSSLGQVASFLDAKKIERFLITYTSSESYEQKSSLYYTTLSMVFS